MTHARHHLHLPRSVGERAADRVAAAMGSWRFIIIQTVIVLCWMTCNVVGFVHHWDIYPFILLNLLFSTQAAYAAPIIMMSQNRQSQVDRLRDDHEAEEVTQIVAILDQLHTINVNQMAILQEMRIARHDREETP
jgi:uncharacterized membrane protein